MNGNLAYHGGADYIREEMIDGKIVLMAPAAANHTFVAGNIFGIFWTHLKGKTCTPISDGTKVFLTEKNYFVPDMMVVCDRNKIKADGVHGAPDLVVEVLSPSTARNDRKNKKAVYERCGVREYWIVNPADKSVEQYFLEDGELVLQEVYHVYRDWELNLLTEEERAAVVDSFQCSLYDDLDIVLEDIFCDLVEE